MMQVMVCFSYTRKDKMSGDGHALFECDKLTASTVERIYDELMEEHDFERMAFVNIIKLDKE